jgi:peptidoglycan/xylan/chitin deacetylase (PgdA/CDA1 family)
LLRSIARILAVLAFAALSVSAYSATDPYLDDLASAAVHMEQGDYERAADFINSALVRRSGDPLAQIALGAMFLHTRQPDRAFKAFMSAQSMEKDNPLTLYGFGLYYLSTGKRDSAKNFLTRASAPASYDVSPALAYLSALSGTYPGKSASLADPVAAQISAQGRFRARDYESTEKILSVLVSNRGQFDEDPGAVLTFDPACPVSFTGHALSKPYRSPTEAEPGLKRCSGTIALKADLTKAQGIAYVLFYVDDTLIGVVNQAPYACRWNTAKYANAPHTVKIQGNGQDGMVLTEKSTRVMVYNKSTQGSNPLDKSEVKRVQDKLWECLRLKPSMRLAYYTLAKCAEAQKDKTAQLSAIERTVAIDPSYKDARQLLIRQYAPIDKYREIWKVPSKQKIAALTFDDGPNPNTRKILDVLSGKGVKATFFVVGQMAQANPEMLRRMAAEGHELEMHTYSHRNMEMLSDIEIEQELVRTASIIRGITGVSSHFFRPPGGHQNPNLASSAGEYGFSAILWTVNCSKNEGTKPENVLKQVSTETVPGSIILMHNVEDVELQALPSVIDALKAKGYKLVTLSELLASG